MKKNDIVTLDITDISVHGEGIGRFDGMPFFVANALPGDRITAGITKLKSTYGYARLISVDKPSPDRVEARCPVADKCGGCTIMALSYDAQLRIKEGQVKNALMRIGGLTKEEVDAASRPIIGMEHIYHYRNKSQYPVGCDKDGNAVAGFYALHSHRIIPIPDEGCAISGGEDKGILDCVLAFMDKYNIEGYDEKNHKGLVRHILIRRGFSTGEVMVCIVINGSDIPNRDELINDLCDECEGIAAICINKNNGRGNVILGNVTEPIYGDGKIRDVLLKNEFRISAQSFYQVNPIQTEKLYQKAIDYAAPSGNEVVWDLYCGIGTIGICMARSAKLVVGIEIVESAVKDARENAGINDIYNIEFRAGDVKELIAELPKPDVIVADPPRKGLDASSIDVMLSAAPKRIVYVSCNPATLARDIKLLTAGGYRLDEYTPVDQFLHGMHVEVVVLMSRVRD